LPNPAAAPEAWARDGRAPAPGRRILSAGILSDAVSLFDVLAVLGAGIASYQAYLVGVMGTAGVDRGQYLLSETLVALLFALLLRQQQAYRVNRLLELPRQLRLVASNLLLAFALLALACFLAKLSTSFSRGWALLWLATSGTTLALSRLALAPGLKRLVQAGHLRRRRAVVGTGAALDAVLDALRQDGEEPADLLRVFPYVATAAAEDGERAAALVATLRMLPLDEVIVACPDRDGEVLKPLIDRLKVLPVDVRLSVPALAAHLPVRGISLLGTLPLIDVAVTPLKHWHVLLKSTFDRGAALALLLLLSPVLLLLALFIKLDSRGPVLFVQERFGFNNDVIRVLKFRSMYVDRGDPSGAAHTVRGDARVTRLGRWLRVHSLDELPQLLNVLRGEMSLVGPRPHPLAMRAGDRLYHEVVKGYFARHRVKPGITGWAQVNGLRGEITSVERAQHRVDYDLWYIDHWSIWLDLKILALSLKVIFETDGAF